MPRPAHRLLILCAFSALCLGLWACSSEDSPHLHNGATGHDADAGTDGTDSYFAGLEKLGVSGALKVQLSKSEPIPQDTGLYTWTLTVLDLNDEPIRDATVQAEPTMPAHGHGTFPAFTEATPLDTPGQYELLEMDLFMAGVWQIAITVRLADGTEDELAFHFHLEG